MKKAVFNIYIALNVLLVAWAVISLLDIAAHNLWTRDYLPFNLFALLVY